MEEYDVVVVGAGPCGSAAAKKAAEKGMKTIMIEEHAEIGYPEHCPGVLAKTICSRGFLEELVDMIDPRAVVSRLKALRIYAPSGRVVETTPEKTSVFARVERKLFDRELAKLAANAGADVVVNTGVTSLITEDGVVRGVNTNSKDMPKVYGKVVISAQGYRAQMTGIPKWEGLTREGLRFSPPMLTLYVTGVKDIDPGIVEFHLGHGSIFPCDDTSCLTGARSLSDFEAFKARDCVMSKKLRDCKVVGIKGFSGMPAPRILLPKKVKDGLILAGDAAGFIGIETTIASGRDAAEVAAEAIKAGDVTEKQLSKFEGLCQELAANIELFNRQWEEVMRYDRLSSEDEMEKRFREREPDVLGTIDTLTPSYVIQMQSAFK